MRISLDLVHTHCIIEGLLMIAIDDEVLDAQTEVEESDDDYILRKTKWFNEETRNQRTNVKLWQDFIAFQDERQELEVSSMKLIYNLL